ncbi:MAG: tetratricopeptide repeat protein [Bacteroidales bacterium]
MEGLRKLFICMAGLAVCSNGLQAQSLEQAKKWYAEGDYAQAKPAFERLVKQSPNNASYNHWYGVCCYETGDLATAEKYLGTGVKRRVQDSYRYLGDLYFKTYRFDEAAAMYEDYIGILAKKKESAEAYKEKLDLAGKLQRMVEKVEDVRIIDSMTVDKSRFAAAYVLSEESGSVAPYKEFFQTNEAVLSTVYMNEIGDKIFYAHPSGGANRYALFTQSKLLDTWGDPKRLPDNINAPDADCNYPFVLPDGVTLYYASKGNGSVGGYDLFVTRYNTNADSYLAPEQLGMPFNSPANDYMLAIDETKGLGWFVSDRNQPEGQVCVYLFIPDEAHRRLEGDDMATKRARAAIASIADTWERNADYSELIRLAHTRIPSAKEEFKKDFEFIVRTGLVYYTLKDFQSGEARTNYEKALDLHRQIGELETQLSGLRLAYAQGNSAKKAQLKAPILQAEEQLDALLAQPAGWEKKARNAEINHLKTNR